MPVSNNTMENTIRKDLSSHDKLPVGNKNKRKRQIQQQNQKQSQETVDTEGNDQGDTNSNTSDTAVSNLPRRSPLDKMTKLRKGAGRKKHLDIDYAIDDDEEIEALILGATNRSQRKSAHLTTTAAGKVCIAIYIYSLYFTQR